MRCTVLTSTDKDQPKKQTEHFSKLATKAFPVYNNCPTFRSRAKAKKASALSCHFYISMKKY